VDDAALVSADVQLHPEVPVAALPGLLHFGVTSRTGVLGRARRGDDRCIHYRPSTQQKAARFAQASDRLEDRAGKRICKEFRV